MHSGQTEDRMNRIYRMGAADGVNPQIATASTQFSELKRTCRQRQLILLDVESSALSSRNDALECRAAACRRAFFRMKREAWRQAPALHQLVSSGSFEKLDSTEWIRRRDRMHASNHRQKTRNFGGCNLQSSLALLAAPTRFTSGLAPQPPRTCEACTQSWITRRRVTATVLL
jgi:hypothetical protein